MTSATPKPRAGEHAAKLQRSGLSIDGGTPPSGWLCQTCGYTQTFEAERDALAAQNRELVEALEKLVELGDHVPVFQLDDSKSSVKAVRLAGKFMGVMAAARALLIQHGR